MKKSMVITVLFLAPLAAAVARADSDIQRAEAAKMAQMTSSPLLMLPGMRSNPQAPLRSPVSALPSALLTDLSNAPNPFDSRKGGLEGQTQISYKLDRDVPVSITLYDLLGVKVRSWNFPAGSNGGKIGANSFLWDGTNESGQKVSKGGYIAQIEIQTLDTTFTAIRKIGVIH